MFDDGSRNGAWLEARDPSQPRIVSFAPSEGAQNGGVHVVVGLQNAESLLSEPSSAGFALRPETGDMIEGTVVGVLSLTDWLAKNTKYSTTMEQVAHLAKANSPLLQFEKMLRPSTPPT
jgi:hypothetical protein